MPISLAPRLDLRPTQTLIMTPQLMQAIKLLQLTNLELSAVIDKELEENPLLERAETDDDGPEPALSERPRAERDTDAAAPDDLPDAVVPADRDMADHGDLDAPPSALDPDAPAVADATPAIRGGRWGPAAPAPTSPSTPPTPTPPPCATISSNR